VSGKASRFRNQKQRKNGRGRFGDTLRKCGPGKKTESPIFVACGMDSKGDGKEKKSPAGKWLGKKRNGTQLWKKHITSGYITPVKARGKKSKKGNGLLTFRRTQLYREDDGNEK